MRILALDLGTKTGWASEEAAGTWHLASPKDVTAFRKTRMDRRLDPRIPTLYARLKAVSPRPDWITWEDVLFSSSTLQTQMWASLRTTVWIFAAEHGIKVECCPTGTLKLFATGHGGAVKEMMAAALARNDKRYRLSADPKKVGVWQGDIFLDDNAVDALHLYYWSRKILRNTQPTNT